MAKEGSTHKSRRVFPTSTKSRPRARGHLACRCRHIDPDLAHGRTRGRAPAPLSSTLPGTFAGCGGTCLGSGGRDRSMLEATSFLAVALPGSLLP